MTSYKAPVKDIKFLLNDFLNISSLNMLPVFSDVTSDLVNAILEEAAKLAENVFHPLNVTGDVEGCRLQDGQVITPKGFKDAYNQYCEGGWLGIVGEEEYGGQDLPRVFGLIMSEFFGAANWSLSMYPGLTRPASETILTWGTSEQKQLFLPKMYEGIWSGTMNLTEPHCGTDLGMLRTKAIAQGDGTYKISGTKIFISAGDQDMTKNIIHLVLARIEGAPAGTGGISLFIVPKFNIEPDGSVGERNQVNCASLEKKMGIHGNATCVMNYDGATGYLLGTEDKGMRAMFTMMNEARLGCGVQGLALADIAQQNAIAYTKDRVQGKAITRPANAGVTDPIIYHGDVRRMLMTNRAFIEGARAVVLWAGVQVDVARQHSDTAVRAQADEMLAFLTPIIKSYLTDQGVEATRRAMQCFGGHGYIHESGVEQFMRDACIAPIYEGTNGVQAMDLVGRKLPANNGAAVQTIFGLFSDFTSEHKEHLALVEFIPAFEEALLSLQEATKDILKAAQKNPENLGTSAHYYLNMFAVVLLGFFWMKMVVTASDKLSEPEADTVFLDNKIKTAKFYFDHMLPDFATLSRKIKANAETTMAIDPQNFI
ncbi:MAG: acyl-CoA dehydrogenase C-terminal domain-containing protein [Emcibacter sp.]|nr:acyl-CoA dehydrogenase C-terminal domain-containing protein [Emcibacter sp.]